MRKFWRDILTDARNEFSLNLIVWLATAVSLIVWTGWNVLILRNAFDAANFGAGAGAIMAAGGGVQVAHNHFGHRSCDDVRP